MSDYTCFICSAWPEADRDRKRLEIEELPTKQIVCISCFAAYFQNLGCETAKQDLEKALAPLLKTRH